MNPSLFPPHSIGIIGAHGQLGHALVQSFGNSAIGFSRSECDLTDANSIRAAMEPHRFRWLINAAAYTNVDGAESDQASCDAINHQGVMHLAAICRDTDCKLIQISSDYLFGASREPRRPWTECDPPCPQGVYARSKWAGEQAALLAREHLVVRTCGLYEVPLQAARSKNFCNTIIDAAKTRDALSIVDDQWCTPTYVPHLVTGIRELMSHEVNGIINVVNEGSTTWYRFACVLLRLAGIKTPVRPIESSQYRAAASRPAYSVLCTEKYHAITRNRLPTWEAALAEYVMRRGGINSLPPPES